MSWIERDGFFLSTAPQGTAEWKRARQGRITASVAAKVMGISPHHNNNDTMNTLLARELLGLEPPKPVTPAMRHGTENEPRVRRWFVDTYCPARRLRRVVQEVGLAVWEDDERFGASLDGEVFTHDGWGEFGQGLGESTEAIEIKSKQKWPPGLQERAKKGANLSIKSIPVDDYVQMQMAGHITGKTHVWYVVSVKNQYYVERVEVDHVYVVAHVIPALEDFYDKYMQPLIDQDPLLKPQPIHRVKLESVKTEANRSCSSL